MKSLFKCLALLGVLLLTASPTVKAGEPVSKYSSYSTEQLISMRAYYMARPDCRLCKKELIAVNEILESAIKPDTSTHTLSVKIVPVGGGTWNYTDAQLFAAVHAAIPDFNPTSVEFQSSATHPFLNAGVYWLHFPGSLTSTGKGANFYFHLEKVGDWYELNDEGIATAGGWSCSGECTYLEPDGDTGEPGTWDVCRNTNTEAMVRCECSNASTDCRFTQYPISTLATMVDIIKQMPPVVE